jgi:ATP-dependent DNA ligase
MSNDIFSEFFDTTEPEIPAMGTVKIGSVEYDIIKSSDVIEAQGSKGKTFWQGHVVRDPSGKYYTATASWRETKSGTSKVNWSEPYYAQPKNAGRSNATTNYTQAVFEFESMVTKERRVRESVFILPMLAKVYNDRKHKLTYPVAVQPKLDGMRMLSDKDRSWSRKAKEWDDPRIIEHIRRDLSDLGDRILDGELILPWFPKVSVTMSAAKRFQPGVSDRLKYFVYDMVLPDVDFNTRTRLLENWVHYEPRPNIVLVETHICGDEAEVLSWHKKFVAQGFEGTMVRSLFGGYEIDKRSELLLKHKDFIDREFEIVDVIPAGGGSSAEVGKFVCRADNGDLFESTATGTEEDRREYLRNKDAYIGKFAKVKYRELTEYGVPFHSNVLEVRETKTKGY